MSTILTTAAALPFNPHSRTIMKTAPGHKTMAKSNHHIANKRAFILRRRGHFRPYTRALERFVCKVDYRAKEIRIMYAVYQ